MQILTTIQSLIDKIQYKDWKFRLLEKGDGFLLQVVFKAPDCHSGTIEDQFCRKFYISPYACASEIIRTAYLCVQQAEMHELNENFKFEGISIYDPHLNLRDISEHIRDGYIREELRIPKPNN